MSIFKMLSEILLLFLMVLSYSDQYTPSTDAYALSALIPMLSTTNFLFDGPASVSYAKTTPTSNKKPTVTQMMYYNYYAASMYCQYQLSDLSCKYCQKFKPDINKYKVIFNDEMDVIALITLSTSRKEIVVTFRGGQNPWTVILALTMFTVCYDGKPCDIKLHSGFYAASMAMYDDVVASVGYLLSLNPTYKIVITGHSLGGAMAQITTFFMLYLDQFPIEQYPNRKYELYSYGSPRVGNKAFVDFINSQRITAVRVTSRADLAVHVVPSSVVGTDILGDYYIHAQTEYWINGTIGQKFANQYLYEDPTCSNSMGPAYSVLDHFLYFDADYLVCWLNEPQLFLAIPTVVQPVTMIPTLPQPIENFLSAAIGFATSLLGPLLGR